MQRNLGSRSGIVLSDEIIQILVCFAGDMAVRADIDGIGIAPRFYCHSTVEHRIVIGDGLLEPHIDRFAIGREHTGHIEG